MLSRMAMINDKVAKLLAEQVGHELKASQEYLGLAIFFAGHRLDGWKAFFLRQSEEEREHALRIVNFLLDVGYDYEIPAVPTVDPSKIGSALEAVQSALNWERSVTQLFRDMATLAHAEKDYISAQFLDWFLNEQIEEENLMDKLVAIVESGMNLFQAERLLPEPEH